MANGKRSDRRAPRRRGRPRNTLPSSYFQGTDGDISEAHFVRWLKKAEKEEAALKCEASISPSEVFTVFKLARLRLPLKDIAFSLGRSPAMFNDPQLRPTLRLAVEAGHAAASNEVLTLHWKALRKGSVADRIFHMKTQMGWSEKLTLTAEKEVKQLLAAGTASMGALQEQLAKLGFGELKELATLLGQLESKAPPPLLTHEGGNGSKQAVSKQAGGSNGSKEVGGG